MKKIVMIAASLTLTACAHVGMYSTNLDRQEGNFFQYQVLPMPQGSDLELTVWASPSGLGEGFLERELKRFAAQEALARTCATYRLDHVQFGQYNTLINGRRYARATLRCLVPDVPVIEREESIPFMQPPAVPPLEAGIMAPPPVENTQVPSPNAQAPTSQPEATSNIAVSTSDAGDKLNAAIAAQKQRATSKSKPRASSRKRK